MSCAWRVNSQFSILDSLSSILNSPSDSLSSIFYPRSSILHLQSSLSSVSACGLHLPRRILDRVNNVLIAGAPAKISFKPVSDFILIRVSIAIEQLGARHYHARRAVTALQTVMFPQAFLNGMQLPVHRKTLDRGHVSSVGLNREHCAGFHGLAVDVYCTRAANRRFTSDVRPRESQHFPEIMNQQQPRLDFRAVRYSIDIYGDSFLH